MATTENFYTGDGLTVLFSFTFPYLEESDIYVSVDQVNTTQYTLANATTIQFNTAPAASTAIRIYRTTDTEELLATFYPGSAIRAQDLNDDFTQTLYVAQEISDRALLSDGSNALTGDFNLNGFDVYNGGARFNKTVDLDNNRITGVADPVANTDAVNKAYVVNAVGGNDPSFVGPSTERLQYTATGGETVLESGVNGVPAFGLSPTKEIVTINGATLTSTTDYTLNTVGDTLTFTMALLPGDVVQCIAYNFAPVPSSFSFITFIPQSGPPTGGTQGTVYFDSTDLKLKVNNGTTYEDLN
jgi:hypothetical protein